MTTWVATDAAIATLSEHYTAGGPSLVVTTLQGDLPVPTEGEQFAVLVNPNFTPASPGQLPLDYSGGAAGWTERGDITVNADGTLTLAVAFAHDHAEGEYVLLDISAGMIAAFQEGGAVDSVNGQTGVVVLDAADVGADATGAAAAVQTNLNAEASTRAAADSTLAGAISAETTRAEGAEATNASAIAAETTRAEGVEATKAATTALTAETSRAEGAESTNATAIAAETTRAEGAESTNATAIAAETTRAEGVEGTKAATTALTAETARAETAEALALPKTGGTMSGAIDMGANPIHDAANGVASTDVATVGQLPVASPPISALVVGGHSYWYGFGNAAPQNQNQSLLGTIMGGFGVNESNIQNFVTGGGVVASPTGVSLASWDAFFQKLLPPTATGMVGSSATGGVETASGPTNFWPMNGQPTTLLLNGLNEAGLSAVWYNGPWNTVGAYIPSFTGSISGSGATSMTASAAVDSTGTFLKNRVGGTGIQAGDYIFGAGIRGLVQVASVSGTTINFAAGTTAQITSSETNQTYFIRNGSTAQFEKAITNGFSAQILRSLAGALYRSDDSHIAYGGSTNAWFTNSLAVPASAGTVAPVGYWMGTGPTNKITYATGDTFTITIDPKFLGGVVSAVLIGTSDGDGSASYIAWTGSSAASGSPNTIISAAGFNGFPAPVITRFLLTAADAGKTIVGTFNAGSNQSTSLASCVLNGTTAVSNAGGFSGVYQGMVVTDTTTGANISTGTTVVAVSGTTISLNQAAAGSATDTLKFSWPCQVDHVSFDAQYTSPVLIGNQSPAQLINCDPHTIIPALNTAINNAIAVFAGTAGTITFANTTASSVTSCGVTNNYSSVALVDLNTLVNKRSFWLGTSLANSGSTASAVTLIGQRTTAQGDQVAPYVGQVIMVPSPNSGDYPELVTLTSVTAASNLTIGGSVYPSWTVSLNRNAPVNNYAGAAMSVQTVPVAVTGSTASLTAQVFDTGFLAPDFTHPGFIGRALFGSAFITKYNATASNNQDWISASSPLWAPGGGHNRTAPKPYNGGYWVHRGAQAPGMSSAITGSLWAQRLVTPETIIIDEIVVDVTTASATGKMYAAICVPEYSGSFPGAVLTDFGLAFIDLPSTGTAILTGYQVLPPGEYWIVLGFAASTTHVQIFTSIDDDMPYWTPSLPAAGSNVIGYTATAPTSGSGTSQVITSMAPTGAWSPATAFMPWVSVRTWSHSTYEFG